MKSAVLTLCIFVFCRSALAQQVCICTDYEKLNAKLKNDSLVALTLLKSANLICQAKGNELMAKYFLFQTNSSNVVPFLQKAEQLYLQEACTEGQLLNIYKYWAQHYYTKADFTKAQLYTFKLLHSAEVAQNLYEEAGCNTMIAQLFNQTNQANKGIIYSRKAVSLLPKITNIALKNDILFKLSKRYLWHYQDTKTKSSLDSSQLFSQQNIILSRQ